ncbi:MAG: tRNA pseudouridine(38-40) synthase TruA [Spirochaetaceae bacterium]|nr:tRNA pseudouridine(38-40) synthase TruA [Spirochaetaceae bacterium]
MRNIKLTLAYDGTDFSGWQTQTKAGADRRAAATTQRTVQGVVEAALAKLHKAPVTMYGAGRTDAGVHAAAQAANFFTTIDGMAAERFVPALNGFLPPDVRVTGAVAVPDSFHARFDAKNRSYRYFIICGRPALPHESRYALVLRRTPDIRLLNDYCRRIHGEFDCSLFASSKDGVLKRGSGSRFRRIQQCYFAFHNDRLVFYVSANAFFWKMVRSMLGTLLFYEERRTPPADFSAILHRGSRPEAGTTAPPHGLFLWNVEY